MDISRGSKTAVSGCGGKTSLIELIAREVPKGCSVLIAPSTKTAIPDKDADVVIGADECARHVPHPGIQYLGVRDERAGKLGALRPRDLDEIAPRYDVVLIEADGSRGLPCKGWTDRDPVVPGWSTHTIGIVPIKAIGLPATEDNVFRVPEFLALTGMTEGKPITVDAIALAAGSADGLFRRSAGHEVFLINQVETAEDSKLAAELARLVRTMRTGSLWKIVSGSVRLNKWEEL